MTKNNNTPKLCHRCLELGIDDLNSQGWCPFCVAEQSAITKNKCLNCGGSLKAGSTWGKCNSCFNQPIKREETEYGK